MALIPFCKKEINTETERFHYKSRLTAHSNQTEQKLVDQYKVEQICIKGGWTELLKGGNFLCMMSPSVFSQKQSTGPTKRMFPVCHPGGWCESGGRLEET